MIYENRPKYRIKKIDCIDIERKIQFFFTKICKENFHFQQCGGGICVTIITIIISITIIILFYINILYISCINDINTE